MTKLEIQNRPARSLLGKFLRDETGASAIEYAIIAGGIAVAIVGAVTLLGSSVSGNFNNVDNAI